MDADTYLFWGNFLMWLEQLPDPVANKLYIGRPAFSYEFPETSEGVLYEFAHSGSGILVSQATMYELAVRNKGLASRWDGSEKLYVEINSIILLQHIG